MHGLSLVAVSRDHSLRGVVASAIVVHELSCSVAWGILPDQGPNPCLPHWQADS